jgi:gliding motility-associated lipoprotein GldD
MMKYVFGIATFLIVLASCGDDQLLIPKPPTYLRLDLPDHSYTSFSDRCPYTFQLSKLFTAKEVSKENCHKDIDLGKLNGTIQFSYIDMEETLSKYVNFSNDRIDEHKLKATAINDQNIIRREAKVFGTFFELQGDVATPFQFYLTDSTDRFVSGVVYMNCKPNYDSLRPTLDYLKVDLLKLMNTFEWK